MAESNPFSDPSIAVATENAAYGDLQNAYDDENDSLWGDADKGAAVGGSSGGAQEKQQMLGKQESVYDTSYIDSEPIEDIHADRNPMPSASGASSLDLREQNLRRKEQELAQRKQRLDVLEKEVNAEGIREDNWPCSYYPITFHSITQEIPVFARSHMNRMYGLVLITFLALFWNLCSILVYYVTPDSSLDETGLLWASVFFGCGIFGSWKLWYRQIYYGIRDNKTIKWWIFFFFFFNHTLFALIVAVAPGYWPSGAAGFWLLTKAFDDGAVAGICIMVSSILWLLIAIASGYMLRRSWDLYKSRGGLEQARGELVTAVITEGINQNM